MRIISSFLCQIVRFRISFSSRKILASSGDKGMGLEFFVSLRAWEPIIPIESVDGNQWKRMRGAFNDVYRVVSARSLLIGDLVKLYSARETLVDSRALHRIMASALHQILFDEEPSAIQVDLWIDASVSFRGRISLKSAGDLNAQQSASTECLRLVRRSTELWALLKRLPNDNELISVILQPFLMSPLINLSDAVLASMHLCKETPSQRLAAADSVEDACQLGMDAMTRYPPFPLFERVLSKDLPGFHQGDHVFIAADVMARRSGQPLPSYVVFGDGPRKCPGKALAMSMLGHILKELCMKDIGSVNVALGHSFSGRLNDGVSDGSVLFVVRQVAVLLIDVWRAFIRRKLYK